MRDIPVNLILRAQTGERAAFDGLFEYIQQPLYRYILPVVRSEYEGSIRRRRLRSGRSVLRRDVLGVRGSRTAPARSVKCWMSKWGHSRIA